MDLFPELTECCHLADEAFISFIDGITQDDAFRQGEWAYTVGYDQDKNPYKNSDYAWGWWQDGWIDSQQNCGG